MKCRGHAIVFDKDSEACRNKLLRNYKEYKDDENALLSGTAFKKCQVL